MNRRLRSKDISPYCSSINWRLDARSIATSLNGERLQMQLIAAAPENIISGKAPPKLGKPSLLRSDVAARLRPQLLSNFEGNPATEAFSGRD